MTTLAYWAVFVVGWIGARDERDGHARPLWPLNPWALATWVVVAVPTILQVTVWPGLFDAGMRRAAAVEDGQVWRLVTSMTLQDGWRSGAVFNLAFLAVTVVVCGPVLAGWRFPAVFVVGGILANVATIVTHGPDGAGNSMATMVTVVVSALLVRASPRPEQAAGTTVEGRDGKPGGVVRRGPGEDAEQSRATEEARGGAQDGSRSGAAAAVARWLPLGVVVVAAALLVVGADEHGWAVVIGLALGAALVMGSRRSPTE
ncbi:putative membrane protein [Nostocoides japonicum T1-X7]|uniref:Putative membrane protein n=1 Tax=Nostocoides japonicum T1-X7 TaxID=1194083 RepID=A0A077M667_9MICO|nr:rhomboid family intramembrane serine protease [Tetrasphaera japonica]CCH79535.1 putative membrane protein [Tetrasphaera japonica T1-X7]